MKYKVSGLFNRKTVKVINDDKMEVILSTCGASIYSLMIDKIDMLLAPSSMKEFYSSTKYWGKTLGRVSGRIPNALYVLNGKTYYLEKNEGENTLHGGLNNLSFKDFCLKKIDKTEKFIDVVFFIKSKDGDCGFPGDLYLTVTYRIYSTNSIEIIYSYSVTKTTPVRLTNHLYYNLGVENIKELQMTINTDLVGILDDSLILSGFKPAEGVFDFRNGIEFASTLSSPLLKGELFIGYDHFFKASKGKINATIESKKMKVSISSDKNTAVVYCNGYPQNVKIKGHGKDTQFLGVTLETCDDTIHNIPPNVTKEERTMISFYRK